MGLQDEILLNSTNIYEKLQWDTKLTLYIRQMKIYQTLYDKGKFDSKMKLYQTLST